jgi:hypothetical protein
VGLLTREAARRGQRGVLAHRGRHPVLPIMVSLGNWGLAQERRAATACAGRCSEMADPVTESMIDELRRSTSRRRRIERTLQATSCGLPTRQHLRTCRAGPHPPSVRVAAPLSGSIAAWRRGYQSKWVVPTASPASPCGHSSYRVDGIRRRCRRPVQYGLYSVPLALSVTRCS